MATRDWEIEGITLGSRSRFQVNGVNHCISDSLDNRFYWGVDSVVDPRFFAAPGLVISDEVQAVLCKVGQIGSGK
jgi:hypothetical protein